MYFRASKLSTAVKFCFWNITFFFNQNAWVSGFLLSRISRRINHFGRPGSSLTNPLSIRTDFASWPDAESGRHFEWLRQQGSEILLRREANRRVRWRILLRNSFLDYTRLAGILWISRAETTSCFLSTLCFASEKFFRKFLENDKVLATRSAHIFPSFLFVSCIQKREVLTFRYLFCAAWR